MLVKILYFIYLFIINLMYVHIDFCWFRLTKIHKDFIYNSKILCIWERWRLYHHFILLINRVPCQGHRAKDLCVHFLDNYMLLVDGHNQFDGSTMPTTIFNVRRNFFYFSRLGPWFSQRHPKWPSYRSFVPNATTQIWSSPNKMHNSSKRKPLSRVEGQKKMTESKCTLHTS